MPSPTPATSLLFASGPLDARTVRAIVAWLRWEADDWRNRASESFLGGAQKKVFSNVAIVIDLHATNLENYAACMATIEKDRREADHEKRLARAARKGKR